MAEFEPLQSFIWGVKFGEFIAEHVMVSLYAVLSSPPVELFCSYVFSHSSLSHVYSRTLPYTKPVRQKATQRQSEPKEH